MRRGRRLIIYALLILAFPVCFYSCDDITLLETIETAQLDLFTGISPSDGEYQEEATPTLSWDIITDAVNYQLQIANTENGLAEAEIIDVTGNDYTLSCNNGDDIYWRVRAVNENGKYSIWTDIYYFFVDIPEYKVGDEGPAGGTIFHVIYDGPFQRRYWEAAPASSEWIDIQWSPSGQQAGADRRAIGHGDENTDDIIAVLGPGNTYAAQLCDGLSIGGFEDWFLPSILELHRMWESLHLNDLGGFANSKYWSSTESTTDSYIAEDLDFYTAWFMGGTKDEFRRVRAVRAF